MGRKFVLPPRVNEPATGSKCLKVPFEGVEDYEAIAKASVNTPLPDLYRRAWDKLFPYIDRTLGRLFECSTASAGSADAKRQRALILCQFLAIGYLGRQSGSLAIVAETADDTGLGPPKDELPAMMTKALNDLAGLTGERQAELIFQRIVAASEQSLKRSVG